MPPKSPPFDISSAAVASAEQELREAEADRIFSSIVLTREIDWEGLEKSGVIDRRELGLALEYDKKSLQDQVNLWRDRPVDLALLLLKVLSSSGNNNHNKEAIEYVIVLIDDAIQQEPLRVLFFHEAAKGRLDPLSPLLKMLSTPQSLHQYAIFRTAHILSTLLSTAPNQNEIVQPCSTFLKYLTTKLTSSGSTSRDIIQALSALKPLMTRQHTSSIFVERFDGLKLLSDLLSKDSSNTQFVYSVVFNLWLLAYNAGRLYEGFLENGIIKKIVQLLKLHVMEKVIRICYSTLAQLLDDHEYIQMNMKHSPAYKQLCKEMIGLNLIQVTDTLMKRKFKDQDILVDMQKVLDSLNETVRELSTFDMYSSEVMSGNLQWSPVHKNEVFWRENINKFDEKTIGQLIKLLSDDDETIREVACFDLGEIARFHPDGKKIISKLNGKSKLMANLQNKNTKIAKQALLAVQKLMVSNWEFLAKSSQGGVASLVKK